ncbi:Hsp20/alpha crystallin family protein [Planctomycetota bacterium]
MSENEKEICVTVRLQPVEHKDMKLTIEKDLAIEGEKKEESQSKGNGYHHVERSYGSFRRINLNFIFSSFFYI